MFIAIHVLASCGWVYLHCPPREWFSIELCGFISADTRLFAATIMSPKERSSISWRYFVQRKNASLERAWKARGITDLCRKGASIALLLHPLSSARATFSDEQLLGSLLSRKGRTPLVILSQMRRFSLSSEFLDNSIAIN